MPKISDDKLKLLFASGGTLNPLFTESVEMYKALQVHADGIFPTKLIEDRRPSEAQEILDYRKKIYEPITKLPISQVMKCYAKIRRSPDWMIRFPTENISSKIPDDETLEEYCTNRLSEFVSITNWAFDILLPQNLIDANAIVAVIPMKPIVPNEFCKPVPILFNSDQVMAFNTSESYCVLRSRIKVNYMDMANIMQSGERFYYIDEEVVLIYEQGKDGFTKVFEQVNTIKQFPVFKVKSELYKQYDNMSLNRSRMHAMVPFLNKAAGGDSDLDGSKIQHLFPLFWYFQNKNCPECNGVGKIAGKKGQEKCPSCENGKVKFSPFAHLTVSAPAMGESSFPFSQPAGYIGRDTQILELQEKTVEKNNYKALTAMNMQFLDQTPLAISGDAKSVDREELNNTVYDTAEDIVYSVDKVLYFINEWRYSYVVPDAKVRKSMLPSVPVPENFDLLPEGYLMKEVTDARTGKVSPMIIATLEKQLASKKFYNQPELSSYITLYFDLDPLAGYSPEDKTNMRMNNAITMEDYVLSTYMPAFVKRALREEKKFAQMDFDKQMALLQTYAKEKMDANDEAAKMINDQKQKVLDELKDNPAAQ